MTNATCTGTTSKKRVGKTAALFGLGLLVGLWSAPSFAQAPEPGDLVRGQSVFQKKGCVGCHAVRGAGGRIGPDLGRTEGKNSFYEIAAGMWNHSPAMGERMERFHLVRPVLEDEELSDLAAFLYFLRYFDEAGDPAVGKRLFAEKNCIRCHTVQGMGGDTGPRLDGMGALTRTMSPIGIAQDLWNHRAAMVAALEMEGLPVPSFAGGELVDLVAYLKSQGNRGATPEFQSAGDPSRGESLFTTKGCRHCHNVLGTRSGIGPDLGTVELRGSVTQVAGRMWNHWTDMTAAMSNLGLQRPDLQGSDLADILAYVFLVRYQSLEGDPDRGEDVYRSKTCVVCHGDEGKGVGDIGPPLREVTTGLSSEEIAQAMWNHGPEMWRRMEIRQLRWPRFEPRELADLLAFLTTTWEEP